MPSYVQWPGTYESVWFDEVYWIKTFEISKVRLNMDITDWRLKK